MLFRIIGFGFRLWGCLYVAYWALMIGIATVIIVTTCLRENKHHPATEFPRPKDHHPVQLRGY